LYFLTYRYLDSLNNYEKEYIEKLLQYIKLESLKNKVEFNLKDWKFGKVSVPTQENGIDCGVFMLMFADFLTDDLPLQFDQRNVELFRKKICAALIRGSINYPLPANWCNRDSTTEYSTNLQIIDDDLCLTASTKRVSTGSIVTKKKRASRKPKGKEVAMNNNNESISNTVLKSRIMMIEKMKARKKVSFKDAYEY
jgi:hypothetical protein